MKNIITAVIAVVCIVIGGIAGNFLKSGSGGDGHAAAPKASHGEAKDSHGEKKDSHGAADSGGHGEKKAKKDSHGGGGHGGGGSAGGSGNMMYFKFSREFVVPLMGENRVESLIILNINLEADDAISGQLFSMEPKIRDNIMTTLIELSSDGETMRTLGNVESYETMRTMILMNLKKVIPSGIENVLIVDMGKQDL
ncbi:MAG: flagellar basal body-associated FliL family protein [Hyphomonas sp.]